MDQRIKSGGLTIGGLIGLIFVAWDKARTAQDMAETLMNTPADIIEALTYPVLLIIFTLMAGFGLSFFFSAIIDFSIKIVSERKNQKENKKLELERIERESRSDCRMPISSAFDYIKFESIFGSSLLNQKDKPDFVLKALKEAIETNKIRLVGIHKNNAMHTPVVVNKNNTFVGVIAGRDDLYASYVFEADPVDRLTEDDYYSSLLLDERDVRAVFPTK